MEKKSLKKTLRGIVVSDSMDKTIVVAVEKYMRHSRYQRVVKRVKKYKVHDEKNEARMGDKVLIIESRPMSKEKRWRIEQILEKAS